MNNTRQALQKSRRLVVKVGTALMTNNGASIDHDAVLRWTREIAALKQSGKEIIWVSSGAIAAGMHRLKWSKRPQEIHQLQAAAAVGQMAITKAYDTAFSELDMVCAQVLLTHDDLADRKRYLNAKSSLLALLSMGVTPVINENDTVITDEIKFGDNDTLGALVANLLEADCLIILTDQNGLYDADPRKNPNASLIHEGRAEDDLLLGMAGGAASLLSRGGMQTKVLAARRAALSGAHTCIANGNEEQILHRLLAGETLGTLLLAERTPLQARKQWLADHLQLAGRIYIDDGAVRAMRKHGSLLPIGAYQAEGHFERGEVVACVDSQGLEIGRGLSNYSSAETKKILRAKSGEIESRLGYIEDHELIHRDNFVLHQSQSK